MFQRILFWVAVLIIEIFSKLYKWLIVGEIAFVFTTTITAATHSIILLSMGKAAENDGDMFALHLVLTSSVQAVILVGLFSPRLLEASGPWGFRFLFLAAAISIISIRHDKAFDELYMRGNVRTIRIFCDVIARAPALILALIYILQHC